MARLNPPLRGHGLLDDLRHRRWNEQVVRRARGIRRITIYLALIAND